MALVNAILTDPALLEQNRLVRDLTTDRDRLTQRVSDLSGAQAALTNAESALSTAITNSAALLETLRGTLQNPDNALDLATAMRNDDDVIASSVLVVKLQDDVVLAKAQVDMLSKAQADLTKAQSDLDAALLAGGQLLVNL